MRPGVGGQVHLLADLPVTDHGAQRFGGPIDKRLFFLGELRLGVSEQGVPVRPAAEQFAIPPHRAGFNGVAFGGRHRRQHALEPGKQRRGKQVAALLRQQQWQGHGQQQQPENAHQPGGGVAEGAHQHQKAGHQTKCG